MNSSAIAYSLDKCPGPHEVGIPAESFGDFYHRILDIAGIGSGDTVACLNGPRAVVTDGISARGASILPLSIVSDEGGESHLRRKQCARPDAVLWAASDFSQTAWARTLAYMRHCLRPGGRRVLWIHSDSVYDRPSVPERIDRLLVSCGFTSVIVGRLPFDGKDAIVATGILSKKAKGGEK